MNKKHAISAMNSKNSEVICTHVCVMKQIAPDRLTHRGPAAPRLVGRRASPPAGAGTCIAVTTGPAGRAVCWHGGGVTDFGCQRVTHVMRVKNLGPPFTQSQMPHQSMLGCTC